jgi:hypothetical protein
MASSDQHQQDDAIGGPFHDTALVGLRQLVGDFKQLFAVTEDLRTRLFGDDQFLHVAEDAANGGPILAKAGFEFAELPFGIGVCRRAMRSRFTALAQCVYRVAKGVRVLAQEEGDFRVDGIAKQQCAGVFRDPLGQHHQLVGGSNLTDTGTALQLERCDLFRQVEQLRILVVDQGDVLAERDQVLLHFEQSRRVLVGLVPNLGQCLQLWLHTLRRGWHPGWRPIRRRWSVAQGCWRSCHAIPAIA